jgi:hypothetical protein
MMISMLVQRCAKNIRHSSFVLFIWFKISFSELNTVFCSFLRFFKYSSCCTNLNCWYSKLLTLNWVFDILNSIFCIIHELFKIFCFYFVFNYLRWEVKDQRPCDLEGIVSNIPYKGTTPWRPAKSTCHNHFLLPVYI